MRIDCGDGWLLKAFIRRRILAIGVEADSRSAQLASVNGVMVIGREFDLGAC